MKEMKFFLIILMVLFPSTASFSGRYIPQGEIASLITAYVLEQLGGEEGEFQVEVLHIPQDVDAQLDLRIIHSPRKGYLGTYLVKLEAYSQETLVREIHAVVRVREKGRVLVAKELIERHQIIIPDQVTQEERKLPLSGGWPPRRLEEINGKRSTRRINKGAILTAALVETVPLVEKGEIINLTLQRPGLCLKAKGRALKDGWIGDVIGVKILRSGKELQAEVKKDEIQILN